MVIPLTFYISLRAYHNRFTSKKMNRLICLLFALSLLLPLASCEEPTGYYDKEQQEIISMLTSNAWRLAFENTKPFPPVDYEDEGWVYKFNANGTGSYAWKDYHTDTIIGQPEYLHWTFTTDNFTVIYIDNPGKFWLIDMLTANSLWVQSAFQDPVIYPNTDKTIYKFTTF